MDDTIGSKNAPIGRLTDWFQLLRIPNLFTVPGDPLAGSCFAAVVLNGSGLWGDWRIYAVMVVSLLCYCAGLLQNDYFDAEEDRRDRPDRPIPSGRVNPQVVIGVASGLMGAAMIVAVGIGAATGITVVALIIAITLYNSIVKRIRILGPLFMGLCRGLSFLTGAALFGWQSFHTPLILLSGMFITIYITFVTHIAAGETDRYRAGAMRWAPGATLLIWFAYAGSVILNNESPLWMISAIIACLAIIWALRCGAILKNDAPPVVIQKTIGRFIRGLLLYQAAVVTLSGFQMIIFAVVLLAFWPVSQRLAVRFYAS